MDDAGGALAEVESILQNQATDIDGDPFLELGADEGITQALVSQLQRALARLGEMGPQYRIGHDVKAALAYTTALSELRQLADMLIDVDYGSVENTRRFRRQLDKALKAIEALTPLETPSAPPAGRPSAHVGDSRAKATPPTPTIQAPDPPPHPMISPSDLHQILGDHFSKDEIRDLCLPLKIKHEELNDTSLSAMARSLIEYCQRRKIYGQLVAEVVKARPGLISGKDG